MTVLRYRRTGTAVQSFRAVAGSSEVATVAVAPPVRSAVAATASFPRVRHKDRVAILPCVFGSLGENGMYTNRTHGPGNQAQTTLDGPCTNKLKDLWKLRA